MNKNILMTTIKQMKSNGDYTVTIDFKTNFKWTDIIEIEYPIDRNMDIDESLLDGDKCREAYNIYNNDKIGTDEEILDFIEKEINKDFENKLRDNFQNIVKKIEE